MNIQKLLCSRQRKYLIYVSIPIYNKPILQMMEPGVLPELEELTLCSFCKQKFNDSDLCPKFLSCKHYFCLKCIQTALMKGRELYCVHCWKRTELGEQGADTLQTYGAVLTLAKNFTSLKIGPGAGGGNKPPDKDRKVDNITALKSHCMR
jgi:hypothetical protein